MNATRTICLAVVVSLVLVTRSDATEQERDRLIVGEVEYWLADWPLSYFWRNRRPRFDLSWTSNHDGYDATWEIAEGKLWLLTFAAKINGVDVQAKDLFYEDLPVHAKWFSGPLYAMKSIDDRQHSGLWKGGGQRFFIVDGDVHKSASLSGDVKLDSGTLGLELASKDGQLIVAQTVSGGPAERSGKIRVEDSLLQMRDADGEIFALSSFSEEKASQFLRGMNDESIDLVFRSAVTGDETEVKLVRSNPFELLLGPTR